MTDDDWDPAEVFCLAEYLAEEMKTRGWTASDLARRLPDSRSLAQRRLEVGFLLSVQSDNMLIGETEFDELAAAFSVSKVLFRGMHAAWLKWPDRRSPFTCPEELLA